MKSKPKKTLDQLKHDLQVLTKEEMQRIKGGRPPVRFSTRWFIRCSGKVPQ
ncbi:MAG: hypothetical protein K9I85_13450 [Saprospiraceae bacterium]|nr:hypothetical protein [Saprospiraceae bacterium]